MSSQPPGTFLPNTKVLVGSHKVYIEKYLSEGGFAHVYVVRIPRDNNKHEIAVLKRVAVPDKGHLASMRTEVETMKKLKGHKHIVTYIDSHASQLKGGGYEVFLLMEYCSGGGLIDFMNTRLQHRLTEPEILKIFADCAEGVACMHYLKPPLLHRDLKVENVLIANSASSSTPTYKICDFGSTAPPRPAAKTIEEGRLIEEDVQKHTTMQYRSPEMIDVWRKQPVDEKADIWALGVLLYKLCYYTTPFEDVGQMAILNASYKYPQYPAFSERLKKLIAWMLKEDPKDRPNIYQVLKEVCSMRGTEVPIKDIYANRTQSEARRNESLPSADAVSSAPVGLQKVAPQLQVTAIPDIAPMRRGRPTAPASQGPVAAKPSNSPARGDPFAALDSKSYDVRSGAVDELAKKYPSLDEFSIAHDGGKFTFPTATHGPARDDLNERVTNALADEVFSSTLSKPSPSQSSSKPSIPAQPGSPSKPASSSGHAVPQATTVPQPLPIRPNVKYSSTGTGSSPPSSPKKLPELGSRPIWKVPESNHHRHISQPRASEAAQKAASLLQPSLPPTQRPALVDMHRSRSQTAMANAAQEASSSRPSLEGQRPSEKWMADQGVERARSVNSKPRPASSVYVSSDMDYLRDQEQSKTRPSLESRQNSRQGSQAPRDFIDPDEAAIGDDMDYLRNSEEGDVARRRAKYSQPPIQHKKRASLNALSGAKQMLAGRFGDALKRFEQPSSGAATDDDRDVKTAATLVEDPKSPSPVAGAQANPSRLSDVDSGLDETEDLPPNVRRELERRRLSQEERRVAEAAADYRSRVAVQGTGGPVVSTRASTIQKRVQSLLDEGRQSPAPRRTAEGYGRYTDVGGSDGEMTTSRPHPPPAVAARSKPPADVPVANNPYPKTRPSVPDPLSPSVPVPSASAPPQSTLPERVIVPRPHAPPKPKALRTGGAGQWPPPPAPPQSPDDEVNAPPPKKPSGLAALLAKDLEGVPDYPPRGSSLSAAPLVVEDDLQEFSSRFPSLSGIEMVETEIDRGRG